MLLNIFQNAIKFTARGGQITVVVELVDSDEIRISVIDNGIGIKQEDQNKVFMLFSSIKDEKSKINMKGLGLGLVISKMIVAEFEGSIDLISKYEKGTCFYFTFKLDQIEREERLVRCV